MKAQHITKTTTAATALTLTTFWALITYSVYDNPENSFLGPGMAAALLAAIFGPIVAIAILLYTLAHKTATNTRSQKIMSVLSALMFAGVSVFFIIGAIDDQAPNIILFPLGGALIGTIITKIHTNKN